MASITACEKNKIRAERLSYNIEKQGASRVCVMVTDARKLDDFFSFDKVLLDAPCTGSGTLDMCQKDAKERLNQSSLKRAARLQEELLVKGLRLLKPGHELVYSTCSILEEENEAVVRKALQKVKARVIPIETDAFSEVPLLPVRIEGTMCVCPDARYEGFFVAKLRL
jgi:16S rRNA C967 or C1407 C5-methylase (RsmB/RsmF family)